MSNFINLTNRSIIEVSGIDCKSFLQGLITNDINKASKENLIYAAMLNAAGRFLYDFFIFANDEKLDEKPDEKLYLDCALSRRDEIIQKLNFYKLRAQVLIKKNDEIKIFHNFSQSGFVDPRHQNLGFRFYTKENLLNSTSDLSLYNFKRIS
ncbi:MAG: hypothetical protein SFV53_02920, partial [Rickettsiales bacterium]|nr:hypothetical protein [Rickettsiales bacterium]